MIMSLVKKRLAPTLSEVYLSGTKEPIASIVEGLNDETIIYMRGDSPASLVDVEQIANPMNAVTAFVGGKMLYSNVRVR
ncbi:MAG: hypothetical protein NT016_00375 [Candidatus Aenigmarchaeota archaeon]|nr:hypothetical protein [Candidatus Aenigmarchaeota archaeon]